MVIASPPPIEDRLRAAGLPPLPRLTWLEVDLGILAGNARALRAALPPGTSLASVVKADGYGHGLVAAAHASLAGGAAMLAVATLDEALALRREGFGAPVLVLYACPAATLADAVEAGVDLVVMDDASAADLAALLRARPDLAPRARAHLGVDTGMTRGGFAPVVVPDAARRLLAAGLPGLAGTWSHLASPEDEAATARQVEAFGRALAGLATEGIDPGVRHLDATGGVLRAASPRLDMVRVGLALYGHIPVDVPAAASFRERLAGLRPALTLRARAASVTDVPAGTRVGYGGTWTAARASRVATVALGYADGWTRRYAPGATTRVREASVPVVGRVGSDAIALDVTDVAGFSSADEVVLVGPDIEGASTIEDLARLRGSIPWEVLDAFTPRISRVYTEAGTPLAVRYLDGRLVRAPGFRLVLEAGRA